MKISSCATITVACLLTGACSFEFKETQDIAITQFEDDERNTALAEELMYYDPRYLVYKIPALTDETSEGIRLGYFVRASDGKPSYRVTYNRSVDAVSDNLNELKSQFDSYIPVLAAQHVSKTSLFRQLEPLGLSWAQNFFAADAGTLRDKSSALFRDSLTVDDLARMQETVLTNYGSPMSMTFARAQFYDEHGDVPESVSLFYRAELADERALSFRVSLHEVDAKWQTMGFGVDPIQ